MALSPQPTPQDNMPAAVALAVLKKNWAQLEALARDPHWAEHPEQMNEALTHCLDRVGWDEQSALGAHVGVWIQAGAVVRNTQRTRSNDWWNALADAAHPLLLQLWDSGALRLCTEAVAYQAMRLGWWELMERVAPLLPDLHPGLTPAFITVFWDGLLYAKDDHLAQHVAQHRPDWIAQMFRPNHPAIAWSLDVASHRQRLDRLVPHLTHRQLRMIHSHLDTLPTDEPTSGSGFPLDMPNADRVWTIMKLQRAVAQPHAAAPQHRM